MTKIEPSEVPERAALQVQDYYDGATPSHEVVAAILSDPAIQRLMVRKCVEGMSEDCEIEGCVCLTAFGIPVFVPKEELVAALCPPEQEEG